MTETFKQLLALGFVGTGVFYVGKSLRTMLRVRASAAWPRVTGTVLRSGVAKQSSLVGPEFTPNRTFGARVAYEYVVDGRHFTSERIHLGGGIDTSFRSDADSIARRYPPGREVAVWHDPEDPSSACLERTADGARFLLLVAAAFAVVGVLVLSGRLP